MDDKILIATTPAAMEAAQKDLISWADAKSKEVSSELRTLREELQIAKRSKWATKPIERRIKREGKRFAFYAKIKAALQAGYYVVPNFAAEAFAIRTERTKTFGRPEVSGYSGFHFPQPVAQLPAGAGRYINPAASYREFKEKIVKDGKSETRFRGVPCNLQPPEFPIALMSQEAMQATERAMATKIFDEIMEARDWSGRGDPMILGRLRNPRQGRPSVTFFIAWIMPLDRL